MIGQPRSILFVTYHFPPEVGGINTRIGKYVEHLSEKDLDLTVFVLRSREPRTLRYRFSKADVIVVNGSSKNLLNNAILLAFLSISKKVDVIHVFTGASTLVGAYCVGLGRIIRAKTFVSFFAPRSFSFSAVLPQILFDFSAFAATRIFTNSSHTKSFLPARFKEKTGILLGGAEPIASSVGGSEENNRIVLFVGRLVEQKGVADLLVAFTTVKERIPDARLVIVGDGPFRNELLKLAVSLKIDSSVEFTGMLFGEMLQRQYSGCSVAVLPSKFVPEDPGSEGLGLTLIEASMHHKPLVGTLNGGIPEVIEDGVNGYLVPPGNTKEIADALLHLLNDRTLAKKMGEAAFNIAMNKFSWNSATERLLNLYQA